MEERHACASCASLWLPLLTIRMARERHRSPAAAVRCNGMILIMARAAGVTVVCVPSRQTARRKEKAPRCCHPLRRSHPRRTRHRSPHPPQTSRPADASLRPHSRAPLDKSGHIWVRRLRYISSGGTPPDLPTNSLDLLDECIVGPLGRDLIIGRCGPPEDLLDAPVPPPKRAGEEDTVLLRRGVLEDDPQLLVGPRRALVALVEPGGLLSLDATLLHDGEFVVKRQVADLLTEEGARALAELGFGHRSHLRAVCRRTAIVRIRYWIASYQQHPVAQAQGVRL